MASLEGITNKNKLHANHLFLWAILVSFICMSFLSLLHLTVLHLFQREAVCVHGSQLAQSLTALLFLELVNSGKCSGEERQHEYFIFIQGKTLACCLMVLNEEYNHGYLLHFLSVLLGL